MQILVTHRWVRLGLATVVVALLAACGQKGTLFLPKGEAAAGRATLPETLSPANATVPPASAQTPPMGQANPVPRP